MQAISTPEQKPGMSRAVDDCYAGKKDGCPFEADRRSGPLQLGSE